MFVKLFKSLAPGRADGGIFNMAAPGGKVCHLESKKANAICPSFLGVNRIRLLLRIYWFF